MIGVDNRADRELVFNDRQVNHRIKRTVCCTARGAAKATFDCAFKLVQLGLVRDVANHTSLSTAAEQRTLRTFKHFDALNVSEIHVGVTGRELHRLIIEIQRDVREAADRCRRLLTGKSSRQAAHKDRAVARTIVTESHVGRIFDQLVNRSDVQLAKRVRSERLDGHRHVSQRLITTGGRNDDVTRGGLVC